MSTLPVLPRTVRVRRVAAIASALALLATALYLKLIPCVFAKVLHVPCPACGSTRAVVALLHGELDEVLRLNPCAPVVALLLGLLGLQVLVSISSHGDLRSVGKGRAGRALSYAFIVVVIVEVGVWIARFFGAFGGPVPV